MTTLKCFCLFNWRPKTANDKPEILKQVGDFSVKLIPGDPACPCDLIVAGTVLFGQTTSVFVQTSQAADDVFGYVQNDGRIYIEQKPGGTPPTSLEFAQLRIEVPLPVIWPIKPNIPPYS